MRRAEIRKHDDLWIVIYQQTVRYNQHPTLKSVWMPSAFTKWIEAQIARAVWWMFGRPI